MNTNFKHDYEEFSLSGYAEEREYVVSEAFPVLMRKVYVWMTLALVITGFTVYYVATSPGLMQLIFGNHIVLIGLVVAELALVIGLSAAINRLSLTTATMMFVLYSVINGATLSSIFFIFTMSSIANVFFITAGTFGVMAFIGYFTKTDLTSMGKLLFMALIGIIIASVVNMFFKSEGLAVILNYLGVLVFVGLTAYDTQKIKEMMMQAPDASADAQKYALLGALTLYLDFINLFLHLLQILGKRE